MKDFLTERCKELGCGAVLLAYITITASICYMLLGPEVVEGVGALAANTSPWLLWGITLILFWLCGRNTLDIWRTQNFAVKIFTVVEWTALMMVIVSFHTASIYVGLIGVLIYGVINRMIADEWKDTGKCCLPRMKCNESKVPA